MAIHFSLAREISHTKSTSRDDFQINIARHSERELCVVDVVIGEERGRAKERKKQALEG